MTMRFNPKALLVLVGFVVILLLALYSRFGPVAIAAAIVIEVLLYLGVFPRLGRSRNSCR
jgi:hypothetical protein